MPLNSAPSNDVSSENDSAPQNTEPDTQQEEVSTAAETPTDVTPVEAETPVDVESSEEPVVAAEAAVSDDAASSDAPTDEASAEAPAAPEEAAVTADVTDEDTGDDAGDAAPAAEDAAPDAAPAAEDSVPDAASASAPSKFKRGEIIEGTVTQTSPTEILIQLEDDIEGIISGRELARMDRQSLDELQIDRTVLVYVLNPSNRNGQVVLSLTRALEEHDWRDAQEYADNQELYTGKVSGYNKGGLIVRFGRVRGFVPASQVSEERRQQAVGGSPMERWGGMIGEDIVVKVVEVDRGRNRLILSERAAIKEWRDQRKAELLDKLEVGDVHEGVVVSLTDFGAFVDLGGADGLVHLTELSWRHVTRPEEVVKIGSKVKVEIISLDRDRRRIGLSMKSQEEDPWEMVVRDYQVGQLVKGTVTKLTKFGAFACLEDAPEIEGLIHISELADHRVGHPREVVNEGEELTLRIVKIDRSQRRMGLSLKQVDAVDYLEIDLASYGNGEPPVLDNIESVPPEEDEAPDNAE
jgi:small subunit ribosomal protein S1